MLHLHCTGIRYQNHEFETVCFRIVRWLTFHGHFTCFSRPQKAHLINVHIHVQNYPSVAGNLGSSSLMRYRKAPNR